MKLIQYYCCAEKKRLALKKYIDELSTMYVAIITLNKTKSNKKTYPYYLLLLLVAFALILPIFFFILILAFIFYQSL